MKWNKKGEGFSFNLEKLMDLTLLMLGVLIGLGLIFLGGRGLGLW